MPVPDQNVAVETQGMARIYLFRESQMASGSYHLRVYDGDVLIGELGMDDYICWERPTGPVRLKVETPARQTKNTVEAGQAVAGKTYYLRMNYDSQYGKAVMKKLRPDDARPIIASRKPAKVTLTRP